MQAQRVEHHRRRRRCHQGPARRRRQRDPPRREHRSGRERESARVVRRGPEEVLLDFAERGPGEVEGLDGGEEGSVPSDDGGGVAAFSFLFVAAAAI